MATRWSKIEPGECPCLVEDDWCYYLGEYTSGGGFQASETNQQIFNLKKSPKSSPGELYHKNRAIDYWSKKLFTLLNQDIFQRVSFVPMPCSKHQDHEFYDDRMLAVLRAMRTLPNGQSIDIRPILYQSHTREPQRTGSRLGRDEILESLRVRSCLLAQQELRSHIIVVDDVITRGASFAAAKQLLQALPNVQWVGGLFLAKTVQAPSDPLVLFPSPPRE